MTFSQRIGKTPIRTTLQIDEMSDELRNSLWNVVSIDFFNKIREDVCVREEDFCQRLVLHYWKQPIEILPYNSYGFSFYEFKGMVKENFFCNHWSKVYDLIEFITNLDKGLKSKFSSKVNHILEREMSGYRIINGQVTPITSELELQSIEQALQLGNRFKSVETHLETALQLLSDRKNPDYRNSIKESISAVESICKIAIGSETATLRQALNKVEERFTIHSFLKKGMEALYSYTNQGTGIRHDIVKNDVTPTFDDAKYMLVSCTAFINYLKPKL